MLECERIAAFSACRSGSWQRIACFTSVGREHKDGRETRSVESMLIANLTRRLYQKNMLMKKLGGLLVNKEIQRRGPVPKRRGVPKLGMGNYYSVTSNLLRSTSNLGPSPRTCCHLNLYNLERNEKCDVVRVFAICIECWCEADYTSGMSAPCKTACWPRCVRCTPYKCQIARCYVTKLQVLVAKAAFSPFLFLVSIYNRRLNF